MPDVRRSSRWEARKVRQNVKIVREMNNYPEKDSESRISRMKANYTKEGKVLLRSD